MQIVSNGDNLHELSNPVCWGKISSICPSAEFAQKVVKVNEQALEEVKMPTICMIKLFSSCFRNCFKNGTFILVPITTTADDTLIFYYYYFSEKIILDISIELFYI